MERRGNLKVKKHWIWLVLISMIFTGTAARLINSAGNSLEAKRPGVASALEATAGDRPALTNWHTLPVVIGGEASTASNDPYAFQQLEQIEFEEPVNADSTRILLWFAFLLSLVAFTASVVGAILLYSRQRSTN